MRTDYELHRLLNDDRTRRRRQRRALLILIVSVALGVGGLVYALKQLASPQPVAVEIDPAKLPPIRPGPPR